MKSNNTKNNTRNNDNIENNLYIKSRRKFIITAILSTIIPPALFFLIPLIIERLDFQWVYDISPYCNKFIISLPIKNVKNAPLKRNNKILSFMFFIQNNIFDKNIKHTQI